MSDNVELKSFPKDAIEAAAYLYIQHQDLTGKSPSEIYELYLTAYYEVLKSHREKRSAGWFTAHNKEISQR